MRRDHFLGSAQGKKRHVKISHLGVFLTSPLNYLGFLLRMDIKKSKLIILLPVSCFGGSGVGELLAA